LIQEDDLKVLIIEDSLEIVESVTLCFRMFLPKSTVSYSYDGHKGLDLLKTGSFDVVILDLNLPEIDGLEVLERIRTFSEIPVVILTVREKEEDKLRSVNLGADDYIIKPFKPRELIARVSAAVAGNFKKLNPGKPILSDNNSGVPLLADNLTDNLRPRQGL
jgi:two-component system, OmpR family, response regulator VicR